MKLTELEVKIRIDSQADFQRLFADCQRFFGPLTSHLRQLDEYYDTPDGQLKKQDLVIRIRTNGSHKTIALKSPRIELPSGLTKRIELEFSTLDGQIVHEQLTSQGLKAFESSEKERWTFVYQEIEIVLDRLPFIGCFIEIEGPDETAIHQMIEKLSLSSFEVIRKNYGELMREKFLQLQLPSSPLHATFAKESEIKLTL